MNIEFRISNLRLAPKCGSFLLCRTILNLCASVCIGSLLTLTPVALAQDLPSLDDLLDLDVPENQNKPKTDDKLIDPDAITPQQGQDAFKRAVHNMNDVAARMGDDRDVSLSLQRSQEQIIKDLDQVIAAAKKQQQQQ